jgi:hypothetical protein
MKIHTTWPAVTFAVGGYRQINCLSITDELETGWLGPDSALTA